jgi:lincosamide nucleotidyltransferase A/C/D/E
VQFSVFVEGREADSMNAESVIAIITALEDAGLSVWLDGGWGIDALVGRQTRGHRDLDLAIDQQHLARAQHNLEALGFTVDTTSGPGLPARLVMKDQRGREVDVHPLVFDATGNGWQQLDETTLNWGRYPAEDLNARGVVAGRAVNCVSPALQFRFHLGYEWSARDRHDLRLLQEHFHVGPSLPVLSDEKTGDE